MTIKERLETLTPFRRTAAILSMMFVVAVVIGYIVGASKPDLLKATIEGVMTSKVEPLVGKSSLEIFVAISRNNFQVLVFMLLGTFTLGFLPALIVAINGLFLGVSCYYLAQQMGILAVIFGIIFHGIIEIPVFICVASVAVVAGETFWKTKSVRKTLAQHHPDLLIAGAVGLGLLTIAAAIEAFITPILLGLVA